MGNNTTVRVLPEQAARVETGPLQFGEDWPGTFIRGDNGAYYAGILTGAVSMLRDGKPLDPFAIQQLESLAALIGSALEGPYGDEFRAKRDSGLAVSSYEYHPAGYIIDGPSSMSFAPGREFIEECVAQTAEAAGDDPEDYTATEVFIRGGRGFVVTPPDKIEMGVIIGEFDISRKTKQ